MDSASYWPTHLGGPAPAHCTLKLPSPSLFPLLQCHPCVDNHCLDFCRPSSIILSCRAHPAYHMEAAAHWTCASVPPTSSLGTKTGHGPPDRPDNVDSSPEISEHTTSSLIPGVSRAMKNWEQKWRDSISAYCPQLSLVIELSSNFICSPSLPIGPCSKLPGIPQSACCPFMILLEILTGPEPHPCAQPPS